MFKNALVTVVLHTISLGMKKPFRITRLEIANIGPFGQLGLDFPEKPAGMEGKAEIHILTGENGTGKTTVLEALVKSINNSMPSNFLERCRSKSILDEENPFFGDGLTVNQNNPKVSLNVFFSVEQPFSMLRNREGSFSITSDNLFVQSLRNSPDGTPIQIAFFAYSGYRRINQVKIAEIREITEAPLNRSLDFQNSINPELILRWITDRLLKEALAKSESDLTSATKFREAVTNIESSLSKILDKEIRFSLLHTPTIDVEIRIAGEVLNFNLLPDGLKSIISWMSDLLMRLDRVRWVKDITIFERNFILFLDEIEVHTHPAWQRKILPVVQELFPNAQIFISTHSPFVVGSVDGAWIHKLVKPNGDSQLAEGYPMLSEDAKSFRYWLEEVFGIKEQFGTEVERDMSEFYELRNKVLQGENGRVPQKLLDIGRALASQSTEVNQIIQMELRQINRQKGLQLSL